MSSNEGTLIMIRLDGTLKFENNGDGPEYYLETTEEGRRAGQIHKIWLDDVLAQWEDRYVTITIEDPNA